eukprot:15686-Heterococcus_DN1.PRE.1
MARKAQAALNASCKFKFLFVRCWCHSGVRRCAAAAAEAAAAAAEAAAVAAAGAAAAAVNNSSTCIKVG